MLQCPTVAHGEKRFITHGHKHDTTRQDHEATRSREGKKTETNKQKGGGRGRGDEDRTRVASTNRACTVDLIVELALSRSFFSLVKRLFIPRNEIPPPRGFYLRNEEVSIPRLSSISLLHTYTHAYTSDRRCTH